jgi:two-component system response regulator (stage 0 sporulation protein A)
VAVIENPSKLDNIMEEIYTPIAKKHGTTINNVERIMRHAVEASWNRCKVSVIAEVFGNTLNANKDKPSNRELIAMLADKIRMKHGLIY